MVLKLLRMSTSSNFRFESDVISDGTQTGPNPIEAAQLFESDVISDGTQTQYASRLVSLLFESDVISDGTQTSCLLM